MCVDKGDVDWGVGDGRVVDRGCVYVDAFNKGVDGNTVEDIYVELSSILKTGNCPNSSQNSFAMPLILNSHITYCPSAPQLYIAYLNFTSQKEP